MTKIYVTEDGERTEATGDVLKYILDTQAEAQAKQAQDKANEETKATTKAALLNRLGITAEEMAALLA